MCWLGVALKDVCGNADKPEGVRTNDLRLSFDSLWRQAGELPLVWGFRIRYYRFGAMTTQTNRMRCDGLLARAIDIHKQCRPHLRCWSSKVQTWSQMLRGDASELDKEIFAS